MRVRDKILYYGCITGIEVALVAAIIGAVTSNGILLLRGIFGLGILIIVFLKVFRNRNPKAQS